MKTLIKVLSLIFLCAFAQAAMQKFIPLTPKANDLIDHFGTEPATNLYGPKTVEKRELSREGILSAGTPITPITNFEKEIIPSQVVAGELDNTAFDASKIVKAELAVPKFDIKSDIVHEAVIKTPVKLGTQFEEKTVTTMNRVTGQVDTKTMLVEKPIVGVLNNVREVVSSHNTLVDIHTGKIIDPLLQLRPSYHGYDQPKK